MNRPYLAKQLAGLGLSLASVSLVATSVSAQAAPPAQRTIRVLAVAGTASLASPNDTAWKKVPATLVALQPAFPAHGSIVGTPVAQQLKAQVVRAGGRLFMKLAWSDRTANTAIKDTNQFLDGAAVQFAVNGQPSTLAFMGDAEHPVNVWRWAADGRAENLVAHGFGTATRVPFEGLHGTSVRTEDGWEVVISRSLSVKPQEGANLKGRRTIPVAFAVWDGANQERDGFKAVTLEWWQLRL
ncbi:ethylbenzene dehydrogenase-related protein [Rhodoferax sp.]|uniref:ethylbenzene dehydrogenase-related protein n=1 Tax=Rhodoferax sp. TaxID=50421 RepID=UPI00274C0005|nr:chlorate reductase subunit gamma [Rhodoferax sp.]